MNSLLRFFFIVLFIVLSNFAFSQGVRKFIGRLVFLEGGNQSISNVPVILVNQGAGRTGTDGIFEISINNSVGEVTLELDKSELKILYPIGGKTGVPKNPDMVINFIVGASTRDILTKAIANSNNEIKSRLTELGVKQDGIEQTLASFLTEIQRMSDIKMEDLTKQIDLSSKREEFYPLLASSINDYINEAKDLKDAFKFTARHAFGDPQALQVLSDVIASYNVIFEDLNKQHSGYEKKIFDLWGSEAKENEVRELFEYALGELHSANIFTLNLKVRDINEYFRGTSKGAKKNASKEAIMREIESSVLQLERRLEILDNRAQVVLSKLAK